MKKKIVIASLIFTSVLIGFLSYGFIKNRVIGPTLTAQEVAQKWGTAKFNEAIFKNGSIEQRAAMASDLMKQKKLIGLPLSEIQKTLGSPTGYFWNDYIPTYLLNEGWKNNEPSWQLVFLPDSERRVKEIIVNKNCCD